MKVDLTRRALSDLERIADHIRAENPAGADRVKRHLENALGLLSEHPLAGRAYAGGRRRYALRRYPYLIFYRLDEKGGRVVVTTVRHAARRPEA